MPSTHKNILTLVVNRKGFFLSDNVPDPFFVYDAPLSYSVDEKLSTHVFVSLHPGKDYADCSKFSFPPLD